MQIHQAEYFDPTTHTVHLKINSVIRRGKVDLGRIATQKVVDDRILLGSSLGVLTIQNL